MRSRTFFARVACLLTAIGSLGLIGCRSTPSEATRQAHSDDTMLAKRVKHALGRQPVYRYPDVQVQARDGVIQLSGSVAAAGQKEGATEIAQRVRGVAAVENDILVVPPEREVVREPFPNEQRNGLETIHTNSVHDFTGRPPAGKRRTTGRGAGR